jgi:hypothetical protein
MAQNATNAKRTDIVNNATTVIKATPGFIGKLVITNVGTAATVTVYDHPSAASGSILWAYVTAEGKVVIDLQARCNLGITVVVNSGGTIAGYITWS